MKKKKPIGKIVGSLILTIFVIFLCASIFKFHNPIRIDLELEVPYPHIVKALIVNDVRVSRENRETYNLILEEGEKYTITFYFMNDVDVVTKKIIEYIPTKEKYQYLKITGEK